MKFILSLFHYTTLTNRNIPVNISISSLLDHRFMCRTPKSAEGYYVSMHEIYFSKQNKLTNLSVSNLFDLSYLLYHFLKY